MRFNKDFFDYVMVTLLIFISGNIVFESKVLLFLVFIVSAGMFFYRKAKFDSGFILFLVVLMVILILQAIKFNFFPANTYAGVYIRILIAYFLIKSIDDFIGKFINVIYYLAIISLIFTALIFLIPGFQEILINNFSLHSIPLTENTSERHNILGLYTIVPAELNFKNAGPFWEMGAYGGYLILTLILSYLREPILRNKVNIVLIITILTTQSSTAYLSLMLLLFFIFLNKTKDIVFKVGIIIALTSIGYMAYVSLPFLGEKIEKQLEMAKSKVNAPNLEGEDSQRFINILKDWDDFQGHEIIGRGPNNITRYTTMYDKQQDEEIRTVGSTDMIVRYGLPFFLWMIFLMYKSFSTYSKSFSKDGDYMGVGIVLVVLLLLSSEVYFLYPLFWIVIMLQYISVPKKNNIDNNAAGKFYNLNKE